MKRKKLVLAANAALAPALVMFALSAYEFRRLRWLVVREDGGMHGILAIALAIAMVYSLVLQMWLLKLFWEPRMRRAFDDFGRR